MLLWMTLATAAAEDASLCRALAKRDVAEVRRLVLAGANPDVFCDNAELGRPARSGSSRGRGRDAVAIVATGGVLAPFIGLGRRRRGGGSAGEFSVRLAIESGRLDLLEALNSAGDVEDIQWCFRRALDGGSIPLARRCRQSLAQPTLIRLEGHMGTPARVALIEELDASFGRDDDPFGIDWSGAWARNPRGIEKMLERGLTRDQLQAAATDALTWGPLEGLAMLRDRFDVPLVVGTINSKWVESGAFRRGVQALDPDMSQARADWKFLADEVAERPDVVDAFLDMGLPPRVFDGSIGPLVEEGHFDVADRMLAAGARPRVDFRFETLRKRPELRAFILEHELAVEGIWTRHSWGSDDVEALLTDPDLLEFTRGAGIDVCQAVEAAAESDRVALLRGQRLDACDAREVAALGTDLELLRAIPDPFPPRAANTIAAQAVQEGRLDVLEYVRDRGDWRFTGYAYNEAVKQAFDAGRLDIARPALECMASYEWLQGSHLEVLLDHLPDERFAELEFTLDRDRMRAFEGALARQRWPAAVGLVRPLDKEDGQAALRAAVEAEAPASVLVALLDTGIDPNYPVDVMGPAVERQDPALILALLERDTFASSAEVERAFTLGYEVHILEAMINRYTKKGVLRRLRRQAKRDGWQPGEVDRLRRPTAE